MHNRIHVTSSWIFKTENYFVEHSETWTDVASCRHCTRGAFYYYAAFSLWINPGNYFARVPSVWFFLVVSFLRGGLINAIEHSQEEPNSTNSDSELDNESSAKTHCVCECVMKNQYSVKRNRANTFDFVGCLFCGRLAAGWHFSKWFEADYVTSCTSRCHQETEVIVFDVERPRKHFFRFPFDVMGRILKKPAVLCAKNFNVVTI